MQFYESNKDAQNLLDIGDDFIYIEITLSKTPTKYSIRPV